jgi:hypothetical protein
MNHIRVLTSTRAARAVLVLFGVICMDARAISYDAGRPLLSLHGPGQQNALVDFDNVIGPLLRSDASNRPEPFVLYVHGRGREPKKSFEGRRGQVLRKLEADDVSVLGFDWDSWPGLIHVSCGRPIENAQASATAFVDVIRRLAAHQEMHSDAWKDRRRILLVHSMGSFVLREAMKQSDVRALIESSFDVRIVSASDATFAGHAEWVPQGAGTWVLTNPTDHVLRHSLGCDKEGRAETGERLGLQSAASIAQLPDAERAKAATYVQLSVKKRHRYFTHGGRRGFGASCEFIHSLILGYQPKVNSEWRVGSSGQIFSIPATAGTSDPSCIGVADDDEDESE